MKNNEQRDRQFPLVAIVAEKDLMTRATLVTLLSYDGYRVFQEDNVNTATSSINLTNDLAVLFVDLDMPGWKSLCGTR